MSASSRQKNQLKKNLPSLQPKSVVMPRSTEQQDQQALLNWYHEQKRDLPWRKNRDAYRIWVSEVMLQQTTVVAVIPFYERFLERFPTLKALAESPAEEVVKYWSGLGYYSRARNLHKAAVELNRNGFPKTFEELLEYPGFGPYTARAVASLAFSQKTGVLDGNVIRILSRRYGLALEWWKPQAREQLQTLADQLAQVDEPENLNQAMMELGATVCTPHQPACLLCPWASACVARADRKIDQLPLKRPRRAREIWVWQPRLIEERGRVALLKNDYAPFLKGQWIFPGEVQRVKVAPKKFSYRHCVTHHDIFVDVKKEKTLAKTWRKKTRWVSKKDLSHFIPATLMQKALALKNSVIEEKGKHMLKKGVKMVVLVPALFALGLTACKSSKPYVKPTEDKPRPVQTNSAFEGSAVVSNAALDVKAKALTGVGENTDAKFSPDGTHLLYLSRTRPSHKHTQIYEYNLATKIERRVTFHNGDDASPSYFPDGQRILYSSSTDESKEEHQFAQSLLKTYGFGPVPEKKKAASPELPFHEIYSQKLDGTQLERLTKLVGYDAEPSLDPLGKRIVFTSIRQGPASLFLMTAGGQPLARLTSDAFYDSGAMYAPDGKALVWIRYSDDLKSSQIWLADQNAQKRVQLTAKVALHTKLTWHPNGQELIFASDRSGEGHFDLYVLDRKGVCLKRLTDSKSDEGLASFSPDGKKLVFTSHQTGSAQIYLMDYVLPEGCLAEQP